MMLMIVMPVMGMRVVLQLCCMKITVCVHISHCFCFLKVYPSLLFLAS